MANIVASVEAGSAVTVSLDRAPSGVGIASIEIVFQDLQYFLDVTYTNGFTELVLLPAISDGVVSFNTRIGTVTLNATDVNNALGFDVEDVLNEIVDVITFEATGNGVTVLYNLASTPVNIKTVEVFINGVYQKKNSYTVTGSQLTFSEAPPTTSLIEVLYT